MFTIDNHQFKRAATPNQVALYIANDVFRRPDARIAQDCEHLDVGQTVEYPAIGWPDSTPAGAMIRVTRVS